MRLTGAGIFPAISCWLIVACSQAFAQDTLRGRVLDRTTLDPLWNVNIISTTSGAGTLTDPEGWFSLPFTPEISVSLLGYERQLLRADTNHLFVRVLLETSAYALQETVVSAFPANPVKLLQSGAAVNVMDKIVLSRDDGTIIAPALNSTTGIYMHSGTLSTNRITIRGIGARTPYGTNKVRAYLKDIPLTSGSGETTVEDIDMDFIERVEVIKGPSSSLHGSGLGGTMVLYPLKPKGDMLQVSQKNTFGSFGLFRNTTGVTSSGKKSNLCLSYNKTKSEGYRDNNTYNRSGLFMLGEYFPASIHTFSLMALYVKVKSFIPSSLDSSDFVNNPQSAAPSWAATQGFENYDKLLAGISHQFDIRKNLFLRTGLSGGFRNNYELRPFNILNEESQYVGVRSSLNYHPAIGKIRVHTAAGGEYFIERYSLETFENDERQPGPLLSDNEEIRRYYNLFVQSAFHLTDKFTLDAGVNLNNTTYDYRDFFLSNGDQTGEHQFNLVVSPRIALSYDFHPGLFLFGNASHGFSPPGPEEILTPEGVINPQLQPETGWNFELGIRGKLIKTRFYYDVSIYSMQISNLLVLKRIDEDQYTGINAGKSNHNGIEILGQYSLIQTEKVQLQVFVNGTFTDYRFDEFVDGANDYSGNFIPGTPGNIINAGIDISSLAGIFGNLTYQFIDEMPLRDDNSIYSTAYNLFNFKVGFTKKLFGRLDLELFSGINNMLNEKYAPMHLINATVFGGNAPRYYYPGLPVNFYAGLSVTMIL